MRQRVAAAVHPVGHVEPVGDFGWACSAAGLPRAFASLEGEVFGGSFAQASAWMADQVRHARAFIVIFTRGVGMEGFLSRLPAEVTAIPTAGGAAARADGDGFTYPAAEDVAILAITEGDWLSLSLTAHFPTGDAFHCHGDDPRRFSVVQTGGGTVRAAEFFRKVRADFGLSPDDWDRLAIITDDNRVLHLHENHEMIVSGANLPPSRDVRLALLDLQRGRETLLANAQPGTFAFGCAGLFGLLGEDRPWEAVMPTTYLFGEIVNANGISLFANLAFTLLIPRRGNDSLKTRQKVK